MVPLLLRIRYYSDLIKPTLFLEKLSQMDMCVQSLLPRAFLEFPIHSPPLFESNNATYISQSPRLELLFLTFVSKSISCCHFRYSALSIEALRASYLRSKSFELRLLPVAL